MRPWRTEDGRTLLICAAPDFIEGNREATHDAGLLAPSQPMTLSSVALACQLSPEGAGSAQIVEERADAAKRAVRAAMTKS